MFSTHDRYHMYPEEALSSWCYLWVQLRVELKIITGPKQSGADTEIRSNFFVCPRIVFVCSGPVIHRSVAESHFQLHRYLLKQPTDRIRVSDGKTSKMSEPENAI